MGWTPRWNRSCAVRSRWGERPRFRQLIESRGGATGLWREECLGRSAAGTPFPRAPDRPLQEDWLTTAGIERFASHWQSDPRFGEWLEGLVDQSTAAAQG